MAPIIKKYILMGAGGPMKLLGMVNFFEIKQLKSVHTEIKAAVAMLVIGTVLVVAWGKHAKNVISGYDTANPELIEMASAEACVLQTLRQQIESQKGPLVERDIMEAQAYCAGIAVPGKVSLAEKTIRQEQIKQLDALKGRAACQTTTTSGGSC